MAYDTFDDASVNESAESTAPHPLLDTVQDIPGTGLKAEYRSWEGRVLAILHLSISSQFQKLCATIEEAEAFIANELAVRKGKKW